MSDLEEKERKAISWLKMFAPKNGEPYWLCYSGGKDSDCIRILAELSGVPYDIEHNLTTVDAPETIRYVKSVPGVHINRPKETMWQLIVRKKIPPSRIMRYCCEVLKEHGGKGRLKITGVRKAESVRRCKNRGIINIAGKEATVRKTADEMGADYSISSEGGLILNYDNAEARRMVEYCYRTTMTLVNPIIDWTDDDVWQFLRHYGCTSNPLYQCGYKRIGCIGCPMQGFRGMKADFVRYPKYRRAYVRAFDKMVIEREKAGLGGRLKWFNGEDVMRWWVGDDPDQIGMDFDEGGDGDD